MAAAWAECATAYRRSPNAPRAPDFTELYCHHRCTVLLLMLCTAMCRSPSLPHGTVAVRYRTATLTALYCRTALSLHAGGPPSVSGEQVSQAPPPPPPFTLTQATLPQATSRTATLRKRTTHARRSPETRAFHHGCFEGCCCCCWVCGAAGAAVASPPPPPPPLLANSAPLPPPLLANSAPPPLLTNSCVSM